uniref:Uncharacterized protein n=1 Tax=Tetradesmus obliquus TaxID=3088 RepID=A0A383W777_TETOB|eukprot:jgi/Sobl393_1/15662/SZX73073.1
MMLSWGRSPRRKACASISRRHSTQGRNHVLLQLSSLAAQLAAAHERLQALLVQAQQEANNEGEEEEEEEEQQQQQQ